ncbi:hypothetical protein CC78DRAFT_535045 [Lojkania enalia]|uniref:Uncharacterized protein n=1 Tax=Lojkania enalia TaxID=147567 RepID=A0A9P4K5Y7_9PLEO|nr:hypothetical protein CC78DRAFT_535045 [Didymosphaeria enalia]
MRLNLASENMPHQTPTASATFHSNPPKQRFPIIGYPEGELNDCSPICPAPSVSPSSSCRKLIE